MWRTARNLLHLAWIAWVLVRYGALYPLEQFSHRSGVEFLARVMRLAVKRRYRSMPPGQRLAGALVALGPSFVKFGQSLSTRSDLLGEAVVRDLSRLQDAMPPFPFAQARRTVEHELGASLDALFSEFAREPVAAASISQVHYAVSSDGEELAVKVLRPGIEASFERDFALFRWIAVVLERFVPRSRRLRPVEVVELFAETVTMEMDLRMEAAAAAELAENFEGDPDFKVPTIDWQRTTRRVLTLERLHGLRPDDVEGLLAAGHAPDAILEKCACAWFNQVFRDGFFHADLHPGNLFVLEDGRIAPIDFGIMGRLEVKTRHFLADMLTGFLIGDYRKVAEVHFRAGYVPAHKSPETFAQACRSIGEPLQGRAASEISLAALLAQLFRVTKQFEMETQPQLLLLQKTMVMAEGVGRSINNRINMWELARPLIAQWMLEHRSPQARARQAVAETLQTVERIPALADRAERAIEVLSGVAGQDHVLASTASTRRRRMSEIKVVLLWAGALLLGLVLLD